MRQGTAKPFNNVFAPAALQDWLTPDDGWSFEGELGCNDVWVFTHESGLKFRISAYMLACMTVAHAASIQFAVNEALDQGKIGEHQIVLYESPRRVVDEDADPEDNTVAYRADIIPI